MFIICHLCIAWFVSTVFGCIVVSLMIAIFKADDCEVFNSVLFKFVAESLAVFAQVTDNN